MAKRKAGKSTQNNGIDGRKANKGRVENLKPFPKGVSGNPGGRPKILSGAYRKYLALPPPPEFVALLSKWGDVPATNAELLAARAMLDGASGNVQALREIRSATEGETVTIDDTGLTDDERIRRIAAILERARARRDGRAAE